MMRRHACNSEPGLSRDAVTRSSTHPGADGQRYGDSLNNTLGSTLDLPESRYELADGGLPMSEYVFK